MQLSFALVFALTILGVQSRAQISDLDLLTPNSNCICTPFYKCYDEETSNTIIMVDDRLNDLCPDILEVCCHNLVPTSVAAPSTTPSPRPPLSTTTTTTTTRPTQISSQIPNIQDESLSRSGVCGVRNTDGVGFQVEGFMDGQAQYGEFPWMAALLTSNTGFGADMGATNLYVGGGSLIDPQVVLTAAHKPFDLEANKRLSVRLGEWNFRAVNEPTRHQDIPVRRVITHPRFDRDGRKYNLALLVLERPAELGATVGTICLPSSPRQNFDGQQCILSGWGKDIFGEEGRYQRILKSVSVNMVGYEQCQSALRTTHLGNISGGFDLHRSFVCAGDQGQDACTGDGGSPLVCPHPSSPGQYVQVGVSAWGIGCGQQGIPGVYATVATAIEWIQKELASIRRGA